MDTPYMLLYHKKGEGNGTPVELSMKLMKQVEVDNMNWLKEVENQKKKIDYGKLYTALLAHQKQNSKFYGPEPKRDFGPDGQPPDVF